MEPIYYYVWYPKSAGARSSKRYPGYRFNPMNDRKPWNYHMAVEVPGEFQAIRLLCGRKVHLYDEGLENLGSSPDGAFQLCKGCQKRLFNE